MRKFVTGIWLLALVLSACAQQTPETTSVSVESPTAVLKTEPPTKAPETLAVTEFPATTEAPATAQSDPASEGLKVYQIIPGESKVTYEVGETFFNQNNRFNLAVGVTPQVSGEIRLDPANPQSAEIEEFQVDISQFQSDSSRRDNAIRGRFLESSAYPMAVFKPTQVEGLPSSYTEGQEISFKVTGDLTVKQTTLPISFDVTAKLENGTLSGVATTTILMSQFGVGPISIGGMLETEDQAKVTLNFVARSQ